MAAQTIRLEVSLETNLQAHTWLTPTLFPLARADPGTQRTVHTMYVIVKPNCLLSLYPPRCYPVLGLRHRLVKGCCGRRAARALFVAERLGRLDHRNFARVPGNGYEGHHECDAG